MIKAILFDLGSTLWDDSLLVREMWGNAAGILSERGFPTTAEDMEAASHAVIASYSPSLTRSIIWQRLDGDRREYDAVMAEISRRYIYDFNDPDEFRRLNPIFPETKRVLAELAPRFRLGVVSQHFTEVRRWIGYHGIKDFFETMAISNELQLFKPDPRLFLHASDALEVAPVECVMVGDRLDNDIFPANRLGMTTVRIRFGLYANQRPRYNRDVPDFTIDGIGELPSVIPGLD